MAESTEQPEQTIITPSKNDETSKAVAKSRGGLWFAIIVLLLIMGVAGAGFYFFSQLRDKQEGLGGQVKGELTRQINDYQAQLTAIQSQVAALQTEIAGKEGHFSKTLADFSDLHAQKLDATRKDLSDKVLQVQRQLGKTRGDWLVADAEYLLSVANERLHLVGDVNTTRMALEAADQRLRESGDSGTIKIREQIAKEITKIQSVTVPDLVGLYTSVQSLESEVEKLSLVLPYSGKPLTPKEEVIDQSVADEQSNDLVNSAIKELEGIVTIKHTDRPVKEILTAEQAGFIREQLRVKLEMLKMALVQLNDVMYQKILDDINSDLKQYFTNNDNAKGFIAVLSRLKSIKLRTQFPDISLSLKMLRDVTSLRLETDKVLSPDSDLPVKSDNTTATEAKENPAAPAKAVETQPTQPPATSKPTK